MNARPALVLALVFVATACGGAPAKRPTATVLWRANARQVVEQLRVDIAAAGVAGSTRADARHALADVSDVYALLVAYSDLGGCRAMVASAAPPPTAARPLDAACTRLQRAAALFARATQRNDAGALVRATRSAAAAQPLLVRAMLAIDR